MEFVLRQEDPELSSQTVDSYRYAARLVAGVVSSGYLSMVRSVPQMYRYIYGRAERATGTGRFREWAQRLTARNLRELLLAERPDVVVCTHAFPCGAMAEYKRLYPYDSPIVVGVVTDFAVHAFWAHANVDAYVVAHEAQVEDLTARGVPRSRICAVGIPTLPSFATPRAAKMELRAELGIPQDRQSVLLMGGGLGMGPIERMLSALSPMRNRIGAVVLAGHNPRLIRKLDGLERELGFPIRVVDFVDNVQDYMHACDILLTKPGGLSSAEALVAGIPMVLYHPLPGQEERNASFLLEHGAARKARSTREVTAIVERLLDDARAGRELRTAAHRLARPQAASDAADIVLESIRRIHRGVA